MDQDAGNMLTCIAVLSFGHLNRVNRGFLPPTVLLQLLMFLASSCMTHPYWYIGLVVSLQWRECRGTWPEWKHSSWKCVTRSAKNPRLLSCRYAFLSSPLLFTEQTTSQCKRISYSGFLYQGGSSGNYLLGFQGCFQDGSVDSMDTGGNCWLG